MPRGAAAGPMDVGGRHPATGSLGLPNQADEHLLRFRGAHGPRRRRSAVALGRSSPRRGETGRVGAADSMWPVIKGRPCRGKLAANFCRSHAWARYRHLVAGSLSSQIDGAHGWRFLRNISDSLAGFVDVTYPLLFAHEQAGQVSVEDHGQRRRGMAITDTVCAHAPPRARSIRGSTGSAEETSAFPATVATLYKATRTHAYRSIARRCCSPASRAFIEPTHTAKSMTSGQRLASLSENPSMSARSRRAE
jgi:hypothetical protein